MFKKILLALSLVALLAGCQRVPAGNVGVKVYLLGSNKGVDSEVVGPGRYWLGWNEELYLFPTFSQTDVWGNEQALSFQTKEGLNVQAAVGITYHIDPTKVSQVFQKYRRGIEEISDLYLRNMVRDAMVNAASTKGIETVYGEGKSGLLSEVESAVKGSVGDVGIVVENIYWVGQLGLPEVVVKAINEKIGATQMAQQRENEVARAKAEADIKIAQARGIAEYNLTIAKSEAEALKIRGEALRNNDGLVALNAVEKWNGQLPTVTGGAVPFMDVMKQGAK